MSGGATARLFVALDPPPEAARELARWGRAAAAASGGRSGRGQAPHLRVLGPESLHLTLCFLGSRPVGEIEEIAGALVGLPGGPLHLSAGAPVWLPPRRPQALAVEFHEGSGQLEPLHARLLGALAAAAEGFEPERRRLRPHITVARVRGRAQRGHGRGAEGTGDEELPPTPQLAFTVGEVVLYRSFLEPDGAVYEEIAREPLG